MKDLKILLGVGAVIAVAAIVSIIYIVVFKVPNASTDLDNTPTENSALDMSVKGYVYDFKSNANESVQFNENSFA